MQALISKQILATNHCLLTYLPDSNANPVFIVRLLLAQHQCHSGLISNSNRQIIGLFFSKKKKHALDLGKYGSSDYNISSDSQYVLILLP